MNRRFLQLVFSTFLAFGCLLGAANQAHAYGEGYIVTLFKQPGAFEYGGRLDVVFQHGPHRIYVATERQIFRLSDDRRRLEHVAGHALRGFVGLSKPATETAITPRYLTFHPVTGQLYFVDVALNRILRLSLDGQRLELVAGTGLPNFDPRGFSKATEANIRPSYLAFHPKTHVLYFVHSETRILTLNEHENVVEVIAGTSRPPTLGSSYGQWFDTDIEPINLAFHPVTSELYFMSRTPILAGLVGDNEMVQAVLKLANTGRVEEVLHSLSFGSHSDCIDSHIDGFGFCGKSGRLYALLRSGKIWRESLGDRETAPIDLTNSAFENLRYDPIADEVFFIEWDQKTEEEHIFRANRNGTLLLTGAGRSTSDGPANEWRADAGGRQLEIDPLTGSILIFRRSERSDGVESLTCKVFVKPDQFATDLDRHLRHARRAISSGSYAEFEAVVSDLKLLSASPLSPLHAVCKSGRRGKPFLGLPHGINLQIIGYLMCDPHQRFRALRGQACVRTLNTEATIARINITNASKYLEGLMKDLKKNEYAAPAGLSFYTLDEIQKRADRVDDLYDADIQNGDASLNAALVSYYDSLNTYQRAYEAFVANADRRDVPLVGQNLSPAESFALRSSYTDAMLAHENAFNRLVARDQQYPQEREARREAERSQSKRKLEQLDDAPAEEEPAVLKLARVDAGDEDFLLEVQDYYHEDLDGDQEASGEADEAANQPDNDAA